MKKVCVMGLGYIGLPTAIIAAEYGFEVVGFDIDQHRVDRINSYDPVIQEPEIFEKLGYVLTNCQFKATATIEQADCFIIAVPTPFKEEKKADLSYVWKAAPLLAGMLKKGDVVILESTVPVGTTQQLADFLQSKTQLAVGQDLFVAHCPERVLPGKIFSELIENPRIIGGITPQSVNQAKKFYKQFVKSQLYLTNATTAEMVKLVENSSRDVEIAFANQVAAMAYSVGLNPFEVIELANKHPRVDILNPSCGVGGHCIAVDPWFLVETFPDQSKLLKSARLINDEKPFQVIAITRSWVNNLQKQNIARPKVLVLGLTYKPDIDDLRESPALLIAQKLSKYSDLELLICEPHLEHSKLQNIFDHVVSLQEGLEQADIILCLVKHSQFKAINTNNIEHKKILDFCGLLYKPNNRTINADELMFWPASSTLFSDSVILMDDVTSQKENFS